LEKVVKNYKVIQKDNGKYVVYDEKGKIVVVTTSKHVCNNIVKGK